MIDKRSFPSSADLSVGLWYPVYFKANFDTPERLIAGVAAYVDGKWHIEPASALERLRCLYGNDANVAIDVISSGLDEMNMQLKEIKYISDIKLSISGIEIGEKQEAHAYDAKELAFRWLRRISSLHDQRREHSIIAEVENIPQATALAPVERDIARDRLSVLVMEQVVQQAPNLRHLFHTHVRKLEHNNSARLITHKAYVAFDGRNVAANFSTLKPGKHRPSVDVAKRLMWDLEQHRDADERLLKHQSHNIYLYHPSENDPTISNKQFANVMDLVETLSVEGQNRHIEVIAKSDVTEISNDLLAAERRN